MRGMDRSVLVRHARGILGVGIPIVLGQFGIILVGFVDNIMVGHHSTMELAAASFVNNFMNLAFIMGMGFSYGLTPLVSSSYAMGDGRLRTLLRGSMVANTLVGLFLTFVMWLLWMNLEWFDQPNELLPHIRSYYAIQMASIVVMMLFYALKQFFDSIDKASTSMWVMLSSNVLNILLNYLLIFGKFGFPELGLVGAGVATLLSRLYCLVVLLIVVQGRKCRELLKSHRADGHLSGLGEVRSLFKLGMPIGLQMGVETASFSLAVIMVGWLGAMELAAHQIISVISTLGFMIFYGLSSAVTIRMSRFYEQRDVTSIRGIVSAGLLLQLSSATLLVLLLLLTRHVIGLLFTDDEALVALVSTLCLPVMIYQYGDVLQILYANALRGLRDVKYMAVCAVVCHIFLALSLVYIFAFPLGLGVIGVWMAFPISLTTLGLLLYRRYRKVVSTLA